MVGKIFRELFEVWHKFENERLVFFIILAVSNELSKRKFWGLGLEKGVIFYSRFTRGGKI